MTASPTLTPLSVSVDLCRLCIHRRRLALLRVLRLPQQLRDHRIALVHEFLAGTTVVLRTDGVLREQWERNRGVAVRDDGVGEDAGVDLAPAHGFGRSRAGESAPDDLIGRDLDEVLVAALG